MANYKSYQQFRSPRSRKKLPWLNIVIVIAILFVVYLIGRSLFGGGSEVESNLPGEPVGVATESESPAESEDAPAPENTNAEVAVDTTAAADFNLEGCTGVYSRGSAAEKQVSLTFNVGTSKEGAIDSLLSALQSSNVTADFFALGDIAESNPDLIKKISSAGFPVYNLGYDYTAFSSLSAEGLRKQLQDTDEALSAITGATTKPLVRPPYGESSDEIVPIVTDEGYCPVTYTVDALDWNTEYTAAQSEQRVLDNVSNGAIIVMQASNSIPAEIVPDIVSELTGQGYRFVPVANLIETE